MRTKYNIKAKLGRSDDIIMYLTCLCQTAKPNQLKAKEMCSNIENQLVDLRPLALCRCGKINCQQKPQRPIRPAHFSYWPGLEPGYLGPAKSSSLTRFGFVRVVHIVGRLSLCYCCPYRVAAVLLLSLRGGTTECVAARNTCEYFRCVAAPCWLTDLWALLFCASNLCFIIHWKTRV